MRIKNLIYLSLLCIAITLTSCNKSSSSPQKPKSPEELRMELKQLEKSSPTDYLSAKGTYSENFWGDKFKLSCTITNKAAVATYKDAIVRVTYYSKTKTELGTKDFTVYELFPPSSSKIVEMSISNYKNVNTIGLDIVGAIPID